MPVVSNRNTLVFHFQHNMISNVHAEKHGDWETKRLTGGLNWSKHLELLGSMVSIVLQLEIVNLGVSLVLRQTNVVCIYDVWWCMYIYIPSIYNMNTYISLISIHSFTEFSIHNVWFHTSGCFVCGPVPPGPPGASTIQIAPSLDAEFFGQADDRKGHWNWMDLVENHRKMVI